MVQRSTHERGTECRRKKEKEGRRRDNGGGKERETQKAERKIEGGGV